MITKLPIFALVILSLPLLLLGYDMQITYNDHNRISSMIYDNGYAILYSYDLNGNIANQNVVQPNVIPLSPAQFYITSVGDQMTLSWEPVTSNILGTPIIVPAYIIEASTNPYDHFTQIGTTSETQFVVSSSDNHCRFFRVIATVNYQRDDGQPDGQKVDTIESGDQGGM